MIIILPVVAAGLSIASVFGCLFGVVILVQLFTWLAVKLSEDVKHKFLWFLAIMVLPEFLFALRLSYELPDNPAVWALLGIYLGCIGFLELMMAGET